jgi:hypothetical protein
MNIKSTSPPVILLEIIADRLGILRIDRGAERIDHLGNFRIPLRSIEKGEFITI